MFAMPLPDTRPASLPTCEKSPRIVPGAAWSGHEAPMSLRTTATAPGAWRTRAMTGLWRMNALLRR